MGQERYGQLYSLEIEESVHEHTLLQREASLRKLSDAEQRILNGDISPAERSFEIAKYNYHEERAHKLGQYCIAQGLIEAA